MSTDVDNWFLGDSAPALSFPDVGTTYEGQIIQTAMRQATDITTGKPKFWDNGDPVMQAVITLDTELRDAESDHDDGVRRLFVGSLNMKLAIAKAMKDVGARSLQAGGTLKVRYTGNGEASKKGFNPPKEYIARYTPPAAVDDFFDESERGVETMEDLSEYSDEPF
jgi:hypothetical protein